MNPISRAGVIGAGTKDHGIAQACAVSGVDVVLVDLAEAAVLHGLSAIATRLDRRVKKDNLTAATRRPTQFLGLHFFNPVPMVARADMIGLDVVLAVMEAFTRDFGDSKYRPAPLLREMVTAGYPGRKTGRGFYPYC